MPYCTQQDLVTRYGEDELIQLTDKQHTGQLDTDVISSAIADADSLIDSYLGSRYSLPINPVPRSLLRIACEITRFYLYEDLSTDEVKDRYEKAVMSLKAISKGEMSIGVSEQGEKPSSQNTVKISTGGNVFNRDDKSFI